MNASADTYQVSTQATNHPQLGVHDAFRHGPSSAAQKVAAGNMSALQARLEKVRQLDCALDCELEACETRNSGATASSRGC